MNCNLSVGEKLGRLLLVLGIAFYQCGGNLEDPEAPARPQWVPKSAPDDSLETGIDADPGDNVIILEWYNGSEEDLAVYRLYRTTDPEKGKFTLLTEVTALTVPGVVLTYIDEEVSVGTDYAYYLRAEDQAGNLSEQSDTVQYRLIPKVDLVEPFGNINSTKPVFKWSDLSSPAAQYVVRVEELTGTAVCWLCLTQRQNYVGEIQSITYGSSGKVYQEALGHGRSYRWRVDAVYNFDRRGNEIAGSESNWGYFTVQ